MKPNYYPDTDSLHIDLSDRASVESREISEGLVLDYDLGGNLVGTNIDNASGKVDLSDSRPASCRLNCRLSGLDAQMHFTESVADEALDAAWADSLERAKARRGGRCRQEKE